MDSLTAYRIVETGEGFAPDVGHTLSRAIGRAGIGVGLAELAVPGVVGRVLGIEPSLTGKAALRTVGLANLVTGLGILGRPNRAIPVWARLAGDVVGVALLAFAARGDRGGRRASAALLAGGAMVALDAYAASRVTRAQERATPQTIFSVTINRPVAEVYTFFRKLENLPLFMDYLERVDQQGERSHWVARTAGARIEWDAIVTEDVPGQGFSWTTVEGSPFAHRGSVTFASTPGGGAGTEVRVRMEVGLPGVAPSAVLARMLTKAQIKGDLRRLKQVVETGEVLYSDASAHRGRHPSQPDPEAFAMARGKAALSSAAAPTARAPAVTDRKPGPQLEKGGRP